MRVRSDFRPEPGEYLMSVAIDHAARCNCQKTAVGAIIARDDRIIATGYNGTIKGFKNCIDGGCPRCKDPKVRSGTELDRCVCVHAEQNALLTAARFGVRVEEAVCWVTTEPCLDCTKQLIQAQLAAVYFWKAYPLPNPESQRLRNRMRAHANKATRFRVWKPKTNVLGLETRYQEIKNRLNAYVQAREMPGRIPAR